MDPSGIDTSSPAINLLQEDVKKGDCILFLGAGVHARPTSKDSPYKYSEDESPLLGGDLAEQLAKECKFPNNFPDDSPRDLQRVSLCYEKISLDRKSLVDSLEQHLQIGKKPSPALEMLAALPFKIIVTTNYDQLLETALQKAGKRPKIIVYEPDHGNKPTPDITGELDIDRPLLFKMHGDLDQRESIVITDEDYITFIQRMSDKDPYHPIPETVRYYLKKWPTLFIGYSLRDYNLRLLFRTLRWRLDPSLIPKSYSVDLYPDPLIIKVWQNKLEYFTFITQDIWNFVPKLYADIVGSEFSR